ncbi:MAG TPA: hypothetical protein VLD65_08025 [Anaerolineales bacterium]|nr:hypothetical protein [Anaerolineales bacterium]
MIIQFFETGGNILNKPKEQLPYSDLSSGSNNDPGPLASKGQFFEIRIKSQLSDIWADWFEGLTVEYLDNGEMLLSGYIVDQSALMGIMNKLVRLNLTLLSVNEITQQKEKK